MESKFAILLFFAILGHVSCLHLKQRAYEDLIIKIEDNVPPSNCRTILENLQISLTSASQYLFSALDSRAYLRSATVLLPASWPDSCAPSAITSGSGEASDVTLLAKGPGKGNIWTQQSLGCGQPGDQIYITYEGLMHKNSNLGRVFVKEFSKFRYGVFEEQGYYNDPIYPMCYYDDANRRTKVTGCSDLEISDNGICSGNNDVYNTTQMVNKNARTSIMFAPEAPSVSLFCDEGNHDRIAPTKQNLICDRRDILSVVLNHNDFINDNTTNDLNSYVITDTTPKIYFKRQRLTRFVFVLENNKDMMIRESWSFLRFALQHWVTEIIKPSKVEVGLILLEELRSRKLIPLTTVNPNDAEKFYSVLPFTTEDSSRPGCLQCGLKDAMDMLNDRTKLNGAANNVIIVIAPGFNMNPQIENILKDLKKSKIKIAAVNFPNIVRKQTLNALAERTNGVSYTVFEQKLNVDSTLLTTYFELLNVLKDINSQFYSGPSSDLPVEIHRRELIDDGRTSVTGSFMLDPNMGEPAQYTLFTHNSVTPLIKSIKLVSPSQKVYDSYSLRFIHNKLMVQRANFSEPGTWTYTVEPFPGNPQPHFIQMTATPKSPDVPVVKSKFWIHQNYPGAPHILLVEVKLGEMPVLGAKVEVTVTNPCNPCNQTNSLMIQKYKLDLHDSGNGDPDITKGDGVYTRYFSAVEGGLGLYTFEVVVSDNGNTAYSWSPNSKQDGKPCCGSSIPPTGVQPISPFQRVLPKQTIYISSDDILTASQAPAGRIGDLRVDVIPEDMKARLSWTSPDMGGHTVSRYVIKYAKSVLDIIDNFETHAVEWSNAQVLPLPPGSETTFTLDFSQNQDLLGIPMYFAIQSFAKMSSGTPSTISNWIRVFVPSPPSPSTIIPNYIENEQSYWPNNGNANGMDSAGPSIAKTMSFGLELILPISIGFILLVVLLILYCYFCVVKRRDNGLNKKAVKEDKIDSTINSNIQTNAVPNSPSYSVFIPKEQELYGVGLPVNNYNGDSKRCSWINQCDPLIDELQQVQNGNRENTYAGVSVISNSLNRNGHTLSPFNSWSASQLLHEHERRHSPLDNMGLDDQKMNGSQIDHMSLNGQNIDHLSMNHHLGPQMTDHYQQTHILPPPVPPLPVLNENQYPVNYNIYGTHMPQNHQIYQAIQRNEMPYNPSTQGSINEVLVPFSSSLQGSMSSVNSGEKKRRNVTVV